MIITERNEIIFNDDEDKTQFITKEELKKAWRCYKRSLHPPKKGSDFDIDKINIYKKESLKWVDITKIYKPVDPIVESVRAKLLSRSQVGIKKYGTTLKDNTKDNYLNHLQMELMDACNYLESLLQQDKDITDIVNKEPNDLELGKKIRAIYGK